MIKRLIRKIAGAAPSAELKVAETILASVRNKIVPENMEKWLSENLEHPSWEIRNISVKIVGLTQNIQFSTHIAKLMTSTEQPGFIRRNAATSLGMMKKLSPKIKNALLTGLHDTYWEVRTQSALSISKLFPPDEDTYRLILKLIFKKRPEDIPAYPIWFPSRIYNEKSFEVRYALTMALGATAPDETVLDSLKILLDDDSWMVRKSALTVLHRVAERFHLSPEIYQPLIQNFDLTCTEFIPVFPIRETWNDLMNKGFGNQQPKKD